MLSLLCVRRMVCSDTANTIADIAAAQTTQVPPAGELAAAVGQNVAVSGQLLLRCGSRSKGNQAAPCPRPGQHRTDCRLFCRCVLMHPGVLQDLALGVVDTLLPAGCDRVCRRRYGTAQPPAPCPLPLGQHVFNRLRADHGEIVHCCLLAAPMRVYRAQQSLCVSGSTKRPGPAIASTMCAAACRLP